MKYCNVDKAPYNCKQVAPNKTKLVSFPRVILNTYNVLLLKLFVNIDRHSLRSKPVNKELTQYNYI